MKGFTSKNVPKSDLTMQPDDSSMGYHFANPLTDYEASALFIGGSDPAEGKVPGDTFKAVDSIESWWNAGSDQGTKTSQKGKM